MCIRNPGAARPNVLNLFYYITEQGGMSTVCAAKPPTAVGIAAGLPDRRRFSSCPRPLYHGSGVRFERAFRSARALAARGPHESGGHAGCGGRTPRRLARLRGLSGQNDFGKLIDVGRGGVNGETDGGVRVLGEIELEREICVIRQGKQAFAALGDDFPLRIAV